MDSIVLTIVPSPTADAGVNDTICEGDTYQLNGAATNYDYVEWTGGCGTFDNANALDAIYTPCLGESGDVVLTLTAYATGGCMVDATSEMTLTIVDKPTVDLGVDVELSCADYDDENGKWDTIAFNNVVVTGGASYMWTSNGDGDFVPNDSAQEARYVLGLNDRWVGDVTIGLEVGGQGECQFTAYDELELRVPQQLITYKSNDWFGISSYLTPDAPASVDSVMDPIVLVPGSQNLVIMINKAGQYFWPEPQNPVNQLGDWDQIGYKLKIKEAPACLPIFGEMLADQSFVIDGAFTYLPVLTNVRVTVDELLGANTTKVLLIYEWSTGKLWTQAAAQLDTLAPGRAYLLVNVNPLDSYTVEFPDYDVNAPLLLPGENTDAVFAVNNSPWNDVVNTSLPHFLLFADAALAEMQPGDIIGAFNQNEECVGMSEFAERDSFYSLIAMGDDPLTSTIDGFAAGELMTFKLYRQATAETYDVTFTYDAEYPSYNGLFAENGVSRVVDMTMSITGVNDINTNNNVNVFPNPAHDVINIASDYNMKSVTLVNYVGQTVFTQDVSGNTYQINVSNYVTGMYFVRIETTDGNVITKRIAVE
jgi:hypothetical protein